jgi:eukaryotic-like serine/threonine-protein kinase
MTSGDVRGRPPRYTVERLLGRGGMASVYLAHDGKLNRRVALKVPADALAGDDAFRTRFLREGRLAARLVHPNVVHIHDAGEDDMGLYIVMEYVDGKTLADELAQRGPMSPAQVAALGVDVCAALDAAHGAGLVHRDVKPHNIMRAEDGATKLADFGVARFRDSTAVTEHGTVIGSAAYLAPEQARGEQVTAAADLYSLGVVLYEALTGRLPHEGESVPELLLRRDRDAPTPVRALAPDVPHDLDAAITSCLARSPDDRPASAAALGDQLGRTSGGDATRVLAPASAQTALTRLMPTRAPHRKVLAIVSAMLLALLALTLGVWAGGDDTLAGPTSPSTSRTTQAAALPAPPPPAGAVQPEPFVQAGCEDEDDGNGRGKGNGKGKAKGHEKQHGRNAGCEEESD